MTDVSRLSARLARIGPDCRSATEEAVRLAAESARDAAAGMAPVDTGRLRSSIEASASGLSAEVSAGCEYAAAVELGSRKRPPRPFLLPAAQASDFFRQAADLAAKAIGK